MTSVRSEESLLAGLNPAQREAVLHVEGPLLVLAGAGSGKTRVLTSRIARLIEYEGVDPRAILAVTFTNKAAEEMRARIAARLGAEPVGMWSGTFHAIGARFLRTHAALAGRTSSFTIYDEDDTLAVVKHVMERLRISTRERPPQAVVAAISDARNALVSVEEYEALARDGFTRDVATVYRQLEGALRQANAVTFDDLLTLPVSVLDQHADVLERYRKRFQFILVDEYQDTNRAQYRLVSLLGGAHGNVAVVGDDDQSIYGWRGADIRNILDFERDFPGARVVRLEENYRSTPQILELANAAIQANVGRKGKTLRTRRPSGDQVTVVAALDERDEADFVIDDMQRRRYSARGRRLSDFAVLYRTNAQSRALEEALRRHGVPYRLVGAVRFYDRREVRDLLAYLKLVANPADDEAFRRAVAVPRRGIGETTVDTLGTRATAAGVPMLAAAGDPAFLTGLRPAGRDALAAFVALVARLRARAREAPVDELLRDLIAAIGYEQHLRSEGPGGAERLENVRELITSAAETLQDEGGEIGLTPLDHFLQRATLVAGVDQLDRSAEAVTLMTLHNAKGLEFPVVYITGLEEGLFPLSRAREQAETLEEERRLFYVGITRAEDALTLTHARSRRRNGEMLGSLPSSFLGELPRELLREQATMRLRGSGRFLDRPTPASRRPGTPVARRAPIPFEEEELSQDTPSFVQGERVRHPRFGAGTIADLAGHGRDTKVTIDFDDESIGRKRLVVAFAALERGVD
ncbi:MAG TPA: UvrD-helicase domain-containing protein [Gemmatimonadaceae bacterium]|nr:UvrD-helicase domain-containing protein [Gemmatimonadaceae bacterium]